MIKKIKKIISSMLFNNMFKKTKLNLILDKINEGYDISLMESKFLSNYKNFDDKYLKDYKLLSLYNAIILISELLSINKKVMCKLCDDSGPINDFISSVEYNYDYSDYCIIYFKHVNKLKLTDNYFYNLLYDLKKDLYYLTTNNEYYEKININY